MLWNFYDFTKILPIYSLCKLFGLYSCKYPHHTDAKNGRNAVYNGVLLLTGADWIQLEKLQGLCFNC